MSPARASSTKRQAPRLKPAPRFERARQEPRAVDVPAREPTVDPAANESELVLAWFRLLARRRGAWLQHLWLADGSIDGRGTVTHAELAGILSDHDAPEAEATWVRSEEVAQRWNAEAEEIRRALSEARDTRFARLAQALGLGRAERELLHLCAAVAFDPTLGRACAYLQDHSGRPYLTADLAARLLDRGRATAWLPEMNVFRWELIHRRDMGVGEPDAIVCDPQVRDWLLGKDTLDETLVGAAKLTATAGRPLPEWPVEEIASWINESLQSASALPLRVVIVAPRGGGRRAFASTVARALGLPLIAIDADNSDDAGWNRFFLRAQRQAFLDTAALAWTGEAAARRAWPANLDLFPVQFVLCEPGGEPRPRADTLDRHVRLRMPEAPTRERLWRESSANAAQWPEGELRRLAAHHTVWPGDIDRAGRLGARNPAAAADLVREAARSRFGSFAQILDCPFTPEDLILPAGVKQVLGAITFEAEERLAFWQQPEAQRLFPQGRGLTALFSGPSGTGKTMAAQVIAARLGQDLCRVNIAQMVSKWVGETSKNYEQVVRVAEENNAVLFFDEADALFAKRSPEVRDAQDKFANTDTAFLLQAIESYQGIAILATNLKANIDLAFLRRLRYVVEFPKPDAGLQRTLWLRLVEALAGKDSAKTLTPVLELISGSADATGAQIKLALLAALFAARAEGKPLAGRHLLTGLDRELGKEGRSLGPRDREKILNREPNP